jgi:hypothetical protein
MVNELFSKLKSAEEDCGVVNTKNWYKKQTNLWVEFDKETPFDRSFSSQHSIKMPAVGSTPSFGRRAALR